MNVIKGRHLGFCKGVERAVNMALAAAERKGKVFTYGELIHNRSMIENLKAKGVIPIDCLDEIKSGDTVLIRTHGVPKKIYDELAEKGAEIIDATCPFVQNIHNKVAEYSQSGYKIIVIGYGNHPEVQGILGWCGDASVVKSEEEVDLSEGEKFYVVVQTTFDWSTYSKIAAYIENSAKKSCKSVVLFNSICYTTKERQSDAVSVAKTADAVLVVGDKNSSNTMRLKGIAESLLKPTFLIENANDLASVDIKNTANVGVLAGASTPKELITEVLKRMATTENNNIVSEDKLSFAELLASNAYAPKSLRPGIKLKVIVNSADALGINVSLKQALGKNDGGFISADEAELDGDYNPENYKAGDELDVVVIEKSSKSSLINLSKKAFDAIKIDDEKVKGILAGEVFDMKIAQAVKGGLLGKIGSYTVFVPASQIRMGFVKNLEEYVGKTLKLKALPPKEETATEAAEGETEIKEEAAPKKRRDSKRIVASARLVIEEEKAAKEDEFWSNIDTNMIVEGKVKRFTPFGAFVSVYGYDCLAHISDIAWNKIKEPGDVLELGKTYQFVILKADRESGKVSLGYKQLQKKPYELAAEKYPVGTVIHGVVGRVQSFGAFIEIEPGIDGLVHVSQIGHGWIKDATQALKIGQEVDAVVTQFDGNKITLSMKELLPEPEIVETEGGESDETAEKPSRTDRFKKRAEGAETERKPRRAKREDGEDGQHEYVSNEGGATMADLFKKLNLDNLEEK